MAKKRKKKNTKKIFLTVLIALLFVLIAGTVSAYLIYGYRQRDLFFKGVVINGIDVGGKTVSEVEDEIRTVAESYTLTVTPKDTDAVTLTADQYNYHFVSDGSVQKLLDDQKWWEWYKSYVSKNPKKKQVNVPTEYDADMLQSLMYSWGFCQSANQTPPVNASIIYQNGTYTVSPSSDGNQINGELLYTVITSAIEQLQTDVDIAASGAYFVPTVRTEDPVLNANIATLNNVTRASITYVLPDQTIMTLDTNTIKTWLSTDDKGNYFRDDALFDNMISEYVQQVADAVSAQQSGSLTFTGQDGNSHTFKTSLFNRVVDTASETENLRNAVYNNLTEQREPVYTSSVSTENGGLGNTFVEVDLTNQKLYYHKDGSILFSCDIVSGTYNVEDRRTPAGVFQLYYKEADRTLKGPLQSDGSYEYTSHVNFWMPFNGGIGFHDASWRDTYGGSLFLEGGSHGCINMPYEYAKELYNNISKNCNVVCYYSVDPNTLRGTAVTTPYASGPTTSTDDGSQS